MYSEREWNSLQRGLYSFPPYSTPPHPYLRLAPYSQGSSDGEDPIAGDKPNFDSQMGKTLAQRIFGAQIGQNRFSARHFDTLLDERLRLYREHQADLQEEINQLRNRLKISGGPYSIVPAQVTSNLQRNLLKLEADQRKHQIDFWKDSTEIRAKLLENTLDYQSTQNRVRILDSLGGEDA